MTVPAFEASRPDDYLTRLAASDLGRSYKALVVNELAIESGDVVLDIGCGPGTDLHALAEATGQGRVIGLDVDAEAVRAAAECCRDDERIEVRVADAHALDLTSASIDRAHTDRVLQHVFDPLGVLTETRRVLRAGGRAVFAEPDWDTLVIDAADVSSAQAYRRFVAEQVVRNPYIGRQLAGLARRCGFAVARVVPVTAVFLDAQDADRILGFERVTRRAVSAGYLDESSAGRWLEGLSRETFFASVTLFVVAVDAT